MGVLLKRPVPAATSDGLVGSEVPVLRATTAESIKYIDACIPVEKYLRYIYVGMHMRHMT